MHFSVPLWLMIKAKFAGDTILADILKPSVPISYLKFISVVSYSMEPARRYRTEGRCLCTHPFLYSLG